MDGVHGKQVNEENKWDHRICFLVPAHFDCPGQSREP